MVTKCAQCGKRTVVLYPDLWVYKRGNKFGYKYLCSWSCLREYDKEKGVEDMSFTQVKKDGTPAKKPGRKPAKKQIETPEGEFVTVATKVPPTVETPEAKPEKITKPVSYDGFAVRAVQGTFGRYSFDPHTNPQGQQYLDYENEAGDELSMTIEAWRDFLAELRKAALVLGVEL